MSKLILIGIVGLLIAGCGSSGGPAQSARKGNQGKPSTQADAMRAALAPSKKDIDSNN